MFNPDNPDLLTVDGVLDTTVLHARQGAFFNNPNACACTTLQPITHALCLSIVAGQFVDFNDANVCVAFRSKLEHFIYYYRCHFSATSSVQPDFHHGVPMSSCLRAHIVQFVTFFPSNIA